MKKNKNDDIVSSAIGRLWQTGSLLGKMGLSFLGNKTLGVFQTEEARRNRSLKAWEKNGERFFETLGRLKGGLMKVGQMISLQEGLLPPEFLNMIKGLQKEAPAFPFESMRPVLEEALPNWKELFEHIEDEPYASASIGQVHRGRLKDGREVVVKIQFPNMEKVIKGDMKNLKALFKFMGSFVLKMDFEPVWEEIRQKLLEELDYNLERKNQQDFAELFKDNSRIIIPEVITEASSKTVLTSEYLPGISSDEIKDFHFDLRKEWSENLLRFFLRQVHRHSFMHSDPNFGNYAFRQDGSIIVYDFGSVKRIPPALAAGYRKLIKVFIQKDYELMPEILKTMGIHFDNGKPVDLDYIKSYAEIFALVFSNGKYCFQSSNNIIVKLMETGKKQMHLAKRFVFPPDVVMVDRAFIGLLGNLYKFGSCSDWGEIVREEISY